MQVKQLKSENLHTELEVTVPLSDIKVHQEQRLQEVGKTVKLPGFRPGKVPMNILIKRYGRAVLGEVLEKVVNETSNKALANEGIKPAAQPKIEVQDFDEDKDLVYTIEVDVIPDFDVMDIKTIALEKPVTKPSDSELKEAIDKIVSQHQGSQPIEGDRATKKGDIVVMDFHGKTKDDGVEHPGMHAHGHKLELGSGQFIPGFEDQLIGKKAGEKITVEVTFPEDYQAAELAGREAEFAVDIEEIHESVAAEFNDDLAKQMGFEDTKGVEEAVKAQMQKEYDQMSFMRVKRQLLDVLDQNHGFDIPQNMWDAEYENIIKQVEQDQGGTADEMEEEDKQELKDIANRRVRLGLVLSQIGAAGNVTVTDQDLQQAVMSEAMKYPGQEKQVFDFYQKNQQVLESLRAPIFEDKVVDMILGQATITEKEIDGETLRKEAEEGDEYSTQSSKKASKKGSSKKSSKKAATKKSASKKSASKKSAKKSD